MQDHELEQSLAQPLHPLDADIHSLSHATEQGMVVDGEITKQVQDDSVDQLILHGLSVRMTHKPPKVGKGRKMPRRHGYRR